MVLWVFAYGSLIWNPNFNYEECVVGYVKGYKRVFHQACIDFRGTAEKPGRTLTLEEDEDAITWGKAYRVSECVEAQMAMAYLNQRERTYDEKATLNVYTESCPLVPAVVDALTYIATPGDSNRWYLGPAPLTSIAAQIARSKGPAGENSEYLFRLAASLWELGTKCVDPEIVELVREVCRIRSIKFEFNFAVSNNETKVEAAEIDCRKRRIRASDISTATDDDAGTYLARRHFSARSIARSSRSPQVAA